VVILSRDEALLLHTAKGKPVFRIERITRDSDSRVVEFARST
jgi:DNA-binding GntR family transcriptional regulator